MAPDAFTARNPLPPWAWRRLLSCGPPLGSEKLLCSGSATSHGSTGSGHAWAETQRGANSTHWLIRLRFQACHQLVGWNHGCLCVPRAQGSFCYKPSGTRSSGSHFSLLESGGTPCLPGHRNGLTWRALPHPRPYLVSNPLCLRADLEPRKGKQ